MWGSKLLGCWHLKRSRWIEKARRIRISVYPPHLFFEVIFNFLCTREWVDTKLLGLTISFLWIEMMSFKTFLYLQDRKVRLNEMSRRIASVCQIYMVLYVICSNNQCKSIMQAIWIVIVLTCNAFYNQRNSLKVRCILEV